MLKNKIIIKKIRNILILLMAIIIMLGAYQNIRNSKAENVIKIELEVADKNNILSPQTITINATETSEGNYLLSLPISVNSNIVTKYYTLDGTEILVEPDNNTATIQLTEEEIANKKAQIQTEYDTKEVTLNGETKLLYNKELQYIPEDKDIDETENSEKETNEIKSQDVIVTGYMPLDAEIEIKEIDLATLTNVKLPKEEETMQKAYEVSIFEVIEKQETAENNGIATQSETGEGEQGIAIQSETGEGQQEIATQAETGEGEQEITTQAEIGDGQQETEEAEKTEYDPSIYGEKITVKTKIEQGGNIKTYSIDENNKITEIGNIVDEEEEYVQFESDKNSETLKYIIATEENEDVEDNIALTSLEDEEAGIQTYSSTTTGTLKSASSETSNTSGFLGNTNIQRQNIESVTFSSDTSGATAVGAEPGLIRHYEAGKYNSSRTALADRIGNRDGIIKGQTIDDTAAANDYLEFDGTDDWVNLRQMDLTNVKGVTLDVVATFSGTTSGYYNLIGNPEDGGLCLQVYNGKIQFAVSFESNNGGYEKLTTSENIATNTKVRITGTYDGSTMKLYVNGVLKKSLSKTDKIAAPINNTVMALGCNPSGSTGKERFWKGKIYSAKIYNKGLTAAEIGGVSDWKESEQGVQTGLLRAMDGYYNDSELIHDDTTTWYDLSEHQNATVSGATWGDNYLSFDGTDDYVNLGQIDLTLTNRITLDVMVEISEIGTSKNYYVIGNAESGGIGIDILKSSGKPRFFIYGADDSDYTYLTSSTALTLNRPTRITAVYDGSKMYLYIDGVLNNSVDKTGALKDAEDDTVMALGSNPKGSVGKSSWFKGKIYFAKIYNEGLTEKKVNQIWDVSAEGDNSILAWYDKTGTAPYQVYIGSYKQIYANANSSYLFANIGYSTSCTATSVINGLGLVNTSNVTNMNYMFYNCGYRKMISLNLGSKFNTSNVTSMTGMFQGCGQLAMTKLELGIGFNNIASTNTNFVTNCGKSGAKIYVTAKIYQDEHHFKLNNSSTTTIEYSRGTIECLTDTTLKSTSSETSSTSGLLENTNIQRQNIKSVTFGNSTIGATKVGTGNGLIRAFDGYGNTNSGSTHDENVTTWGDLIGNQDGIINGATWGTNYLEFDGKNDWVNLGEINLNTTNKITLDAIISVNDNTRTSTIIGNQEVGGIRLGTHAGKPGISMWFEGDDYYTFICANTQLNTNTPYRITATYNGSKMALYINGKLATIDWTSYNNNGKDYSLKGQPAELEITKNIKATTKNTVMSIGCNPKGSESQQGFFNGNVYMAKIYNVGLSQTQIQQIWDVSEKRR